MTTMPEEDYPDTTPGETSPDVGLGPTADAPIGKLQCRYCSEQFNFGPGGMVKRGNHEKREHRDEWQAAKAKRTSHHKQEKRPESGRTPAKRGPRRPKAPERISAIELAGMVIAGIGSAMRKAPPRDGVDGQMHLNPLVVGGRVVGFEAPIAGAIVDEAVAGTRLDRIAVQPLLAGQARLERVAPLVLAPLIATAIAARPEMWPVLSPVLKRMLRPQLPAMLAELRRAQAEEAEEAETIAAMIEIDPAFAELFGDGAVDPLDAMMAKLFAGEVDSGEDTASEAGDTE